QAECDVPEFPGVLTLAAERFGELTQELDATGWQPDRDRALLLIGPAYEAVAQGRTVEDVVRVAVRDDDRVDIDRRDMPAQLEHRVRPAVDQQGGGRCTGQIGGAALPRVRPGGRTAEHGESQAHRISSTLSSMRSSCSRCTASFT